MGTTYRDAEPDTLNVVARAMRQWHQNLTEAGVRVGVLMAENAEGDAIKSGGYAVLACIKVVSLKDRVSKEYDAELLIDGAVWDGLREEQQLSLADHELSHIDLRPLPPKQLAALRHDDPGAPWWQLDDLGRPKLKTVLGDWNAGDGFKAVVERHGKHAIEYVNLAGVKTKADECKARHEAEVAAQPPIDFWPDGEVPPGDAA